MMYSTHVFDLGYSLLEERLGRPPTELEVRRETRLEPSVVTFHMRNRKKMERGEDPVALLEPKETRKRKRLVGLTYPDQVMGDLVEKMNARGTEPKSWTVLPKGKGIKCAWRECHNEISKGDAKRYGKKYCSPDCKDAPSRTERAVKRRVKRMAREKAKREAKRLKKSKKARTR